MLGGLHDATDENSLGCGCCDINVVGFKNEVVLGIFSKGQES